MDALERFQELSPFQSCIKYNGRSILPPVVSSAGKSEIDEIRCKAIVFQARLEERKLKKIGMVHEVTAAHNASGRSCPDMLLKDADNDNNQLKGSQSLNETVPLSIAANSNSSLQETSEKDKELVIIPGAKKPCDGVNQRNAVFRNSLLDNVESFQKDAKCINAITLSTYPNHERYVNKIPCSHPCDLPVEHLVYAEHLLTPSEISVDQRLSKMETGQPIGTVIENMYEELHCDLDSDNVIASVMQNNDLNKHVNSSVKGNQSSEDPWAVGDGKNVTECLDYFEAATSSETTIDHSNASEPVVALLLQSFKAGKQSKNMEVNPFNPVQPINNMSCGKESKGCISLNAPPNYLQPKTKSKNFCSDSKKTMSKNVLQANVNTDKAATEEKRKQNASSRHKRNGSYTLDKTSSALLKSHAGCPCLESSFSVGIPHSTSIEFMEGPLVSDYGMPQKCATTKKNIKDQTFCMNGDIYKKKMHSMNTTKCENRTNEKASGDGTVCQSSSNQVLLDILHETFKKMHDQRTQKLLREQHEQRIQLQLEFDEQKQQLEQQMQSLHLNLTDGNYIHEFCSTISQVSENLLGAEPKRNAQEGYQRPRVITNHASRGVVNSDTQLLKDHSEVSQISISSVSSRKSKTNWAKSDRRTSVQKIDTAPPETLTAKCKLSSATLKRLERKRLKNQEEFASIERTRSAANICLGESSITSKLPVCKRSQSVQGHSTSSGHIPQNAKMKQD